MAADHPAIECRDVRLRLGSTDFHFDGRLAKGAITAVTGASGSGKSTFLNLLAGFETPDQGEILMAGRDMAGLHPAERPVSLVFQDNNLFAHLDVFTNVGLGISPSLRLTADDRSRIAAALDRVGLPGFEKRSPPTLSGGERQRVAFARALVRQKPILLLDEPFASLDPGLRAAMADLLRDLHRETGNSTVIVTHDPDEVRRLADRAIFIAGGTIALEAPVADFLASDGLSGLSTFFGR